MHQNPQAQLEYSLVIDANSGMDPTFLPELFSFYQDVSDRVTVKIYDNKDYQLIGQKRGASYTSESMGSY